ncbi:MAG TPA: D-aminoacyl-tRNA deacylase, partial [Bacteroidales bacterium]|nr:D-aminoacyl-tRNA deacylase [Bacteroidales bacterium]
MRVLIQRVSQASVIVNEKEHANITNGLLVFLGIVSDDNAEDIEWLIHKIVNMRIFNDDNGVMNRSLLEIAGNMLIVSQFTLHAKTKKGNRPSYYLAANPSIAFPLYNLFVKKCNELLPTPVETGIFGANMK